MYVRFYTCESWVRVCVKKIRDDGHIDCMCLLFARAAEYMRVYRKLVIVV